MSGGWRWRGVKGRRGKKVWWGRKGWEGQVRLCGPPPLSEPT